MVASNKSFVVIYSTVEPFIASFPIIQTYQSNNLIFNSDIAFPTWQSAHNGAFTKYE